MTPEERLDTLFFGNGRPDTMNSRFNLNDHRMMRLIMPQSHALVGIPLRRRRFRCDVADILDRVLNPACARP